MLDELQEPRGVANGGHPAGPPIHFHVAGYAGSLLAQDCDDLVAARVAQVLDLESEYSKDSRELAEVVRHLIAPSRNSISV